jgi:hypothetical protein
VPPHSEEKESIIYSLINIVLGRGCGKADMIKGLLSIEPYITDMMLQV